MASASIVIEQTGNPQPVGVAGRSRDDLSLTPVVMRNADDTDVSAWRWSMLDKPAGSAATIGTPTSPSISFTPDVPGGTWRIGLQVNTATLAETTVSLAAVLDDFGHRRPAAGELGAESNWLVGGSPNRRGWSEATNPILAAIDQIDLLSPTLTDLTVAVSASEMAGRGGLGLPSSIGDVAATDFVDLNPFLGLPASVGPAPVVNGIVFTPVPVPGATYTLCIVNYDLDTSASTVGDKWSIITTRANPAKRFLFAGIEVV